MSAPEPIGTTSVVAAIANGPSDPFEIAQCELQAPRAGEVRVRVHACGICHTDLAVKLQHIPIPLPKVLGHEGAGIVEEIGPGVTQCQPGDHVLMSFGSCGECGNCRDGALGYCDHFRAINLFGERAGGSALARNRRERLAATSLPNPPSQPMLSRPPGTSSRSIAICRWNCSPRWDAESRPAWARS